MRCPQCQHENPAGAKFCSECSMADEELELIDRAFAEGTPIDAALIEAVRQARQRHKEAGNPVVEWRDGKLCWVAPQDIEVDDKK